MLCQVAERGSFLVTWVVLSVLALVMTMAMSGLIFYRWYWRPSFAQWQRKSNPEFPAPGMVRREVLQMVKGLLTATLCPALSLHLVKSGWSKAYCGVGERGVGYLILTFFVLWIGTDFFEFYYHRLGHITRLGWKEHKAHHVFHNPSPFAVIADDAVDQLIRATPMLLFPLIMPINMDLLFLTFAAFFYGYGAYLHWGYELSWPDAHHPWINTAFQHYLHHAKSALRRPYHTGFFFKIWDKLFGSVYQEGECLCSKCCVARGERSEEAWAKLAKPDYSVLFSPAFWWSGQARDEASGGKASSASAEPLKAPAPAASRSGR
jgi:Delta7-sterol 5-desaturase